jgi:hypothetical protein
VPARPFKIALTQHADYFKVVKEFYSKIEQLHREHDEYQSGIEGGNASDRDVDFLASKNDAIGEFALVVIVFSAFTLEAYINHYGISRLSKNYFTKYLDKLDLVAKWLVVPRIVTGQELDPGSRAMQDLSWLVCLRNRLAHFKSKIVAVNAIQASDFLWDTDAERALNTVRGVISLLGQVDTEAETDWVES